MGRQRRRRDPAGRGRAARGRERGRKAARAVSSRQARAKIRRSQEALRRSERRYRSFVEVTSQFGWVTDARGMVVEDIPAFRQFTGQDYEHTKGAGWTDALHPEDLQRTVDVWRRAVATLSPYEIEYRLRRRDGEYRLLHARGVPVLDDRGDVVEWVGTCIDVTDRNRTEAALRQSESRFRAAVESMADGFAILSAVRDARGQLQDLRYEYINEAGARLNLRPAEDHLGKTVLELLPAHRDTDLFRSYLRAVQDGDPVRVESVEYEDVYGPGRRLRRVFQIEASRLGDGLAVTWRDRTASERAKRALQESEERLQRAQELAHLGSWELDLVTNRLTWSDEVYRIFGEEPQRFAATYEAFLARVHPDDRAAVDAAYSGSIREGRDSYEIEHRIVRHDTGEVRHVRERCLHRRDARGTVVMSLGMVLDVTERRRAEEALRLSEETFRTIAEGLPQLVFAVDADGTPWFFNRRWSDYTGREPGSAAERSELVHPDDRPRMLERWRECVRTGAAYECEYRFRRYDGAYRWFLSRAFPVRAAGGVIRWFGAATDIHDVKAAQEALARSVGLLESVFTAMTDGVVVCDADGRILRTNEAAKAIYGVDPSGANAMAPPRRLPSRRLDGRPIVREELPAARALSGESVRGERFVLGDDEGGELVVEASAAPLRVDDAIAGAVTVWHDITELVRAQDSLREADRRKSEFIGVLSHELRNPLAPIANSLYVLDHAAPEGEQANRARQVIGRQVAQLSRLVDDLLDVTRITRGKIHLQRERLELGDLVRRAVEDHRSMFEDAEVRLEVELGPGPVPVFADRTRLAQVVGNLLQNAVKFSGQGGRTRVSVAAEGDEAVVRVADDGIGMDAATVASLFQPFVQADHSLDRSKGGLGLGLALVKGLVELHGGKVVARSEGVGRGTELTVRLPLDAEALREPRPTAAEPAATAARRVLVIEDNVDAAQSLRDALTVRHHEVAVAYDGPEGIARARELRPEVVLCDIGLPGMSGFDVARALRAEEGLEGVFLVAVTGYALAEDLQRAAEAGFDRHVSKPPDLGQLEGILAEAPAAVAKRAGTAAGSGRGRGGT